MKLLSLNKLLLVLPILFLCSCQKEISYSVASPVEVDVYVAGYTSDDANYPYPAYNPYLSRGEHPNILERRPVQLDYHDSCGADNYKSGKVSAIAVSGNNAYVAGYGTWLLKLG